MIWLGDRGILGFVRLVVYVDVQHVGHDGADPICRAVVWPFPRESSGMTVSTKRMEREGEAGFGIELCVKCFLKTARLAPGRSILE